MEDINDIIGGGDELADLLGTPKKSRKRKAAKKTKAGAYKPLEPTHPVEGGIWERRAEKGKNLGRTCLICNKELKYRKGRPPVLCGTHKCFRAYRNKYRKDYDAARGAA